MEALPVLDILEKPSFAEKNSVSPPTGLLG